MASDKLAVADTVTRFQLKIDDLAEVLRLLKSHGYSGVSCYGFGLFLGLSPTTLDVIKENNKGDLESCLRECLKAWLQKADKVQEKGGPSIYSLISALRELGKNAVADGIDMEKHPACKIFAHYISNLTINWSPISALHHDLAVKFMHSEKLTSRIEASALLDQVKEAVCKDYQNLEAFAEILRKSSTRTTTAAIGSDIKEEYRRFYCSNDLIEVNDCSNDEPLTIALSTDITSKFKLMRLKLGSTFFKVESIMMRNHRSLSLDHMKYALSTYDKALRPELDECQNIRKILKLVCDNCPLDDIMLLEFFVDEFNIEKAKEVIRKYKKDIKKFKATIKLRECLEKKFSNALPLKCEKIIIVVEKEVSDLVLDDIKRLVSDVFENLSPHVKLNVIRKGSFTITCSFSLVLSKQLISVAQGNIYILRANKVKRLTIGYCTVYEVHRIGSDEQEYTLSSTTDSGLLKQMMVSLSIQLTNSREDLTYEESMTLEREAKSLIQKLDTKIEMLGDRRAENIELRDEYYELKQLKEIFAIEEQLASFKLEEEDKVTANEVQRCFYTVNVKLPRIARSFNTSVTETKVLVDEATNGLEVVRKYKEVKEAPQVKESYRSLSKSTKAVHTYLDKVNRFYQKLKDQTPAVIEDIESGRSRSTEELAVGVNEVAQYCKNDYTTLRDCFREFATSSDRAQIELTRLKEETEAERKRKAIIAAGVTAAGTFVGVLTFGLGIGVGAVAATAAAAAVAYLAYLVVAYGEGAESFGKINQKRFKDEQYDLMQNMINEITQTMTENTKIKRMTDAERTNLATTMKAILEESIKLYSETSRELENAERIKNTFTREVDNTFN